MKMNKIYSKVNKEIDSNSSHNPLINTCTDQIMLNYKLYINKDILKSKGLKTSKNTLLNEVNNDGKEINNFVFIESRNNLIITPITKQNVNASIINCLESMKVSEKAIFTSNIIDDEELDNLNYFLKCIDLDLLKECKKNAIAYELEILDCYEFIKSKYEMTSTELFNFAKEKKESAIKLFKESKYNDSMSIFKMIVDYIGDKDLEFCSTIKLNIANCLLKLERYEEVITECNGINKKSSKLFYYKASAFLKLQDSEENIKEAEESIIKLSEYIGKDDQVINSLNEELQVKKQSLLSSQKHLYKNFFKAKNIYNDKPIPKKEKIPLEINKFNPVVYFDISVGEDSNEKNRVEFELFADVTPKTSENFLLLASTNRYKDTIFHRFVKDFMMQGGDYENFNGTGGKSIYGGNFEDENFIYSHEKEGLLSMANSGPNTNGSQFFITFKSTPWLDNKHVVFGRVLKGLEFLMELNNSVEVGEDSRPYKVIKIKECGRYEIKSS